MDRRGALFSLLSFVASPVLMLLPKRHEPAALDEGLPVPQGPAGPQKDERLVLVIGGASLPNQMLDCVRPVTGHVSTENPNCRPAAGAAVFEHTTKANAALAAAEGLYPRTSRMQVMHTAEIATIDEHVESFRRRLIAATDAMEAGYPCLGKTKAGVQQHLQMLREEHEQYAARSTSEPQAGDPTRLCWDIEHLHQMEVRRRDTDNEKWPLQGTANQRAGSFPSQ